MRTPPEGIADAPSLIQLLKDALHQIEASKSNAIHSVDLLAVEEHFWNLHSSLKKKFEELEAREEEYQKKVSKTHALVSEREVTVVVKEQDLLDRIQELKDAAVADIAHAQPTHKLTSAEFVSVEDSKETKVLRRNSQGKGGHSSDVTGVQGGAKNQELVALKAIIRCINVYKLEAEYPLDPLRKRLDQLDRPRSDRKRPTDFGRHQQLKKPKPTVKHSQFHGGAATSALQTPPVRVDRTVVYGRMPERYSQAAAFPHEYQVPSQLASGHQTPPAFIDRASYSGLPERYYKAAEIPYDYQIGQSANGRRTPPALVERPAYMGLPERYSQAAANLYDYQVAGRSAYGQPATDQQTYYYREEDRVAPTLYRAPPSSYNGYTSGGLPSLHYPYR